MNESLIIESLKKIYCLHTYSSTILKKNPKGFIIKSLIGLRDYNLLYLNILEFFIISIHPHIHYYTVII